MRRPIYVNRIIGSFSRFLNKEYSGEYVHAAKSAGRVIRFE